MTAVDPRVLVLASWYPSAVAPTAGVFIREQVRALAQVADVAVIHVDAGAIDLPPTARREEGVTVVRAGVAASSLYARFVRYRRAGFDAFSVLDAEWGMPDIVHVQALFPAAIIAHAYRRRYGIPYVVTEHSEEYLPHSTRRLVRTPGMLPLVLRPLARSASHTIAVSRFLADRLSELGLATDPVVIPNVVPLCEPKPLPVGAPHVISHVSIMGPAKNLDILLRAIAVLSGTRDDFVLRLVGDGECRAETERLARELGLGDRVEFVGERSQADVVSILGSAAFTVVSSAHETFSVSAAESLMCGRPVLSTRCGGPEEFVTPSVGRLVDAGDVDALADGLRWMLDHFSEFDPAALHSYAAERFAPDVVAARILDVYRTLPDRRRTD